MGAGRTITNQELSEMLAMQTEGIRLGLPPREIVQQIAERLDRSEAVVWKYLRKLRPTTQLAKIRLQAGADSLVKRILKDASVAEAIDILSRPNVGILDPIKKTESTSGGGFFLSVQTNTLGAVKVGMTNMQPPALPAAESTTPPVIEADFFAEAPTEAEVLDTAIVKRPSQRSFAEKLAVSKEKLRIARANKEPEVVKTDRQMDGRKAKARDFFHLSKV